MDYDLRWIGRNLYKSYTKAQKCHYQVKGLINLVQTRKCFLMLHVFLVLYSIGGVFSKKAASECFFNAEFLIYYSLLLLTLVIYALGWQQIIKVLPLSTAFANKAITVVWGLVWGKLLFNENITVGKLIGIGLIVAGIVLLSYSGKSVVNE